MTDKPQLSDLLQAARATREVTEKFNPILIYSKRDEEGGGITVLEGDSTVQTALKESLIGLHEQMGPAEWVAFTSDTFRKRIPENAPPEDRMLVEGQLGKEFNAGSPEVVEMMIVIVADPKEIETMAQSYRYLPSEGWEWDAPETIPEEDSDGMVTAILKAFFLAQEDPEVRRT